MLRSNVNYILIYVSANYISHIVPGFPFYKNLIKYHLTFYEN